MMEQYQDLWTEVSRTYHVHEETLLYTKKCLELSRTPSSEMSIEEARDYALNFNLTVNGYVSFQGQETDIVIPTADNQAGVPVTVYCPACRPPSPPVLVYFHGGSLIMGSRRTHENSLKIISGRSGAIIISVEYRLLPCPENPMAPFTDAVEVTEWVLKYRDAVGGTSKSAVGVGGDSAGGQIACCVVNNVTGIDFQVLIYPVTDFACHLPSFQEFRDIPAYNTEAFERRLSITNTPVPDAATNPKMNPSAKKDFTMTPPTLVISAQLDPLRDSCWAYTQRLTSAGVKVQHVLVEAVPHGFFALPGIFKTKSEEAFSHVVNFLRLVYSFRIAAQAK